MPATYSFVPGAVAANTPTNLPADAPDFILLQSCVVETHATGGVASTTSPAQATVVQTIPTGGLQAGQFAIDYANRRWQYGSATTAGTVFVLHGFVRGEVGRVA